MKITINREVYAWIAVFVAILAAALYLRYFYQPALGIELGLAAGQVNSLYPYQSVSVPINIYNNGSAAIKNISIGLYVNGNLSKLYKVTLPVGKSTTIVYNYTAKLAGTYNVSVEADPGKLYNIVNRQKAVAAFSLLVKAPEAPAPYLQLPAGSTSSAGSYSLARGGVIVGSYLYSGYNESEFKIIGIDKANSVMYPVISAVAYYTMNMSAAYANYTDGSRAYSVWLMGYVSPNMTATAAKMSNLSYAYVNTAAADNVTFVKVSNDTSVCSYYSNGWIKILAFEGNSTCADKLNGSAMGSWPQSTLYPRVVPKNVSLLGNFTDAHGQVSHAASLYLVQDSSQNLTSVVYASLTRNGSANNVCYGLISSEDNVSYCSTYLQPVPTNMSENKSISLIETTAYVGSYNLSVISLANTLKLLEQVPINIGVIQRFNITGASVQYGSALKNACSYTNSQIGCTDGTFTNSILSVRLTNNYNETVSLKSLACYQVPPLYPIDLNGTLAPGQSINVTAPCYSLGQAINGLILGLKLNMLLNYTVNGTQARSVAGSATIPFG